MELKMGKKVKICERCNLEIHDGKQDKAAIYGSIKLLKMIHFAGAEDMEAQLKGMCANCKKEVMRSAVVPQAQSMIDAIKKEDKEKKK